MKRIRKCFLGVLSCLCVACTAIGIASCSNNDGNVDVTIETLAPKVTYRVGDNINVLDLFQQKEGITYHYTIMKDGESETKAIEGNAYYLAKAGVYTITCTAKSGKNTDTESVTIEVYDKTPYMMLKNETAEVAWNRAMFANQIIIGLGNPTIISEAAHTEFIESVVIYDDVERVGRTVNITEGVATEDGFYDGNKFHFVWECDYLFHIVCETSGGRSTGELLVTAREDLSVFADLEGYNISYNSENRIATWDTVEDAVSYRVKVDFQTVITTETTLDIDEYCVSDFQYFDLAVIAKNAEGEEFGKLIVPDVVIAPEGSEGVVKGDGAIIDSESKTVTLIGTQAYTASAADISKIKNSYMGYGADYGVGTYVDFIFTGNNLPQVCFFADEMNGNLTSGGGTGYILMNGLYSENKGTSVSPTPIIGENRLVCIGPDRLHPGDRSDPLHNYIIPGEQTRDYFVSEDTLFTQKYLREDTSGRTYRYVAGSFDKNGMLAFDVRLYDYQTEELIAFATYVTKQEISTVKPGKIIAYACIKGNGNDTTFTYTQPYEGPLEEVFLMEKGATINADGSTTLEGKHFTGAQWTYNIASTLDNNYIAMEGKHGVGTYVDITFMGNNMPHVMLFADKINGIMTSNGGNGLLLSNGLYSSNFKQSFNDAKLVVNGPNRIENKGSDSTLRTTYEGSNILASISYNDYPLLTQKGLSEDNSGHQYKYTVGTYLNAGDYIVVDILLFDITSNTLLYDVQMTTALTKEDISEGYIVLYDGVKGATTELKTSTTFAYSEPYKKPVDPIKASSKGATLNDDGSITLAGTQFTGAQWTYNIASTLDNNYVALKGEYGIGTYIDITFTGNNMPHVMFFADQINGIMTSDGGNGLLLSNGLYSSNFAQNMGYDNLFVHGPTRILNNGSDAETRDQYASYVGDGGVVASVAYSKYPLLTQKGLTDSTDTYKYTVGTYLDENSKIVVDIILYNVTTSAVVYDLQLTTTLTESDVTVGSIVLYDGVKGKDTSTTFFYTEPYKKENKIK